MQLTRFDRWLREKFVYQTHIQTLRPVDTIPAGVRARDLPDIPGRRYKHLFVADSSKAADELIRQLKENNQMYATRIVDRDAWYVPFVAPKDKSVTWWIFSMLVILAVVCFILLRVKDLVQDPEFRQNIMDTLKLLKS